MVEPGIEMPRRRLALLVALAAAAACVDLRGCVYYLHPQCSDQIHNGSESDIDCGGTCRPCDVGFSCGSEGDCDSGICIGGTCAPPPCANGVQGGAETDVDCGGGTCRKCAGGRGCLADGDCFSGTCDPGTSTCSSLRNVSFADPVSYPAGYKTYALFASDVDGDGLVDLVAANEQGDSVSVFLGQGDGTFGHVGDFTTGAYPTGVAIADLNGDGIPDILTANYHGDSVSVLFGVGDGTFQAARHYPTAAGAQTQNLALGDLDGDGYPDVIATNLATSSVSLFKGRSDGALEPAVDVPVGILGASVPYGVVIADFDGDGKNDMAITDSRSQTTIVRLGHGDGSFGPEEAYPGAGYLVAFDVDLDGRLDLIAAHEDVVGVLLGRGDGTFHNPLVSTTGAGSRPYSLAVGDFNLDGVPDVVTANFASLTASVLLGIGDGRFESPLSGGETGLNSYGAAVADFNGDGKPDFATCNAGSYDVKVSLNTSQ
jgi:hypothetical protein